MNISEAWGGGGGEHGCRNKNEGCKRGGEAGIAPFRRLISGAAVKSKCSDAGFYGYVGWNYLECDREIQYNHICVIKLKRKICAGGVSTVELIKHPANSVINIHVSIESLR